jgi:lipid-A-disaccharide synthase
LLLSIFPFEKEWYAARAPKLRVEFVGHPMVGRFQNAERGTRNAEPHADPSSILHPPSSPRILLLPGSRWSEVRRHWPVVTGAFEILRRELPGLRAKLILPDDELVRSARTLGVPPGVDILTGEVPTALADGDLAVTKSGTITLECAMFGVPAVVFYKTSWLNYAVAKPLMKVKYLAMPNLLANEEVFPELIQGAATAANIAGAALELLRNDARRRAVKAKLARIVATLGAPGAPQRAAEAIVSLLP